MERTEFYASKKFTGNLTNLTLIKIINKKCRKTYTLTGYKGIWLKPVTSLRNAASKSYGEIYLEAVSQGIYYENYPEILP